MKKLPVLKGTYALVLEGKKYNVKILPFVVNGLHRYLISFEEGCEGIYQWSMVEEKMRRELGPSTHISEALEQALNDKL